MTRECEHSPGFLMLRAKDNDTCITCAHTSTGLKKRSLVTSQVVGHVDHKASSSPQYNSGKALIQWICIPSTPRTLPRQARKPGEFLMWAAQLQRGREPSPLGCQRPELRDKLRGAEKIGMEECLYTRAPQIRQLTERRDREGVFQVILQQTLIVPELRAFQTPSVMEAPWHQPPVGSKTARGNGNDQYGPGRICGWPAMAYIFYFYQMGSFIYACLVPESSVQHSKRWWMESVNFSERGRTMAEGWRNEHSVGPVPNRPGFTRSYRLNSASSSQRKVRRLKRPKNKA